MKQTWSISFLAPPSQMDSGESVLYRGCSNTDLETREKMQALPGDERKLLYTKLWSTHVARRGVAVAKRPDMSIYGRCRKIEQP